MDILPKEPKDPKDQKDKDPKEKEKDPARINHRPKNPGPLWHLSVVQLKSILTCAGIPIPEKGTGTGTRGSHKGGGVVKEDLVNLIRTKLYGQTPDGKLIQEKTRGCEKRPTGCVQAKTGLYERMLEQRVAPAPGPEPGPAPLEKEKDANGDVIMESVFPKKFGGRGTITAEDFFETSFSPANCISGMGFREGKKLEFPHVDRLSYTIISFSNEIAVWQSSVGTGNSTIIGQRLGKDKEFVNMWEWSLNGSVIPVEKWVDEETHIMVEPIRIRAKSVCKGDDGNYYGFTLFSGKWFISLEKLFKELRGNTSFPVMSALSLIMSKILSLSDRIGLGGRDTQHYAWRFTKASSKAFIKTTTAEKDPHTWLVIGLLPLPYIPHDKSPYKLVPVDALLRTASRGIGGAFLNKMINK